MIVPKKAMEYYLGKDFTKLKIPEAVQKLKAKGVDVNDDMVLLDIFKAVRSAYAKEIRKKT